MLDDAAADDDDDEDGAVDDYDDGDGGDTDDDGDDVKEGNDVCAFVDSRTWWRVVFVITAIRITTSMLSLTGK